MTNPHSWLKSIGATESLREIASRAGVSHATLSRQITAGRFLIETTLEIARAYDASPITALVANGYLTEEEAGLTGVDAVLASASDEQLVNEVGRRLGLPAASILFDQPISTAVATASNVVQGNFGVGAPAEDDEEAVARQTDPEPDEEQ